MSSDSLPVSPPVPPPLHSPHNNSASAVGSRKHKNEAFWMKTNECLWASSHADLHRACFLARVCQHSRPQALQFHEVAGIIQNGPNCGLTAISIMMSSQPPPEIIVEEAKRRKFTNNGEMFSAASLLKMVEWAWSSRRESADANITMELFDGTLDCDYIRGMLKDGAFILVAYDPDFNHQPMRGKGHKAHWALITGFLIDSCDKFHVIARHGKTNNIAIWCLKELSESNSDLREFAEPVSHQELTFLLPPGGLDGPNGICNKAIVIQGLTTKLIKLSDI